MILKLNNTPTIPVWLLIDIIISLEDYDDINTAGQDVEDEEDDEDAEG